VHLYEDKGEDFLQDLRGMFGLALYDLRNKKLVLACDRFGIKPIYYMLDNEKLLFGSELKSLLQDPELNAQLDLLSVNTYFSFMNTVAPDTIFKEVKKLMPGHYLTFEHNRLSVTCYWHFTLSETETSSEEECREQLLHHLQESIKLRMISDVPLGAFLSGGIDSSTIVAMMSEVSDRPIKTFSIGFDYEGFNELPYARIVAERFATDHNEFVVQPDATDIVDELVWYLDEPFSDPSAIPTYFVSKIAREHVTVVLTGDGGDEMFGGYPHYRAEGLLKRLGKIPPIIRNRVIKKILEHFPRTPVARVNEQKHRLLRNLDRINMTPESRFFHRHELFSLEEKQKLYSVDVFNEIAPNMAIEDRILSELHFPSDLDDVDQLLYLDTHIYLPNDMLTKVDRMSMANSLEARVPLLDHVLAEYVATLPHHYKVKGRETKYILKKAMESRLPHEILYRKKQGFDLPLSVWFRNELGNMARSILLDRQTTQRGLFKKSFIEHLISLHTKKERDLSFQIWSLIVFEKWCRSFLDGRSSQ
jgi:asparagine synthase (glutamine-hydrolysing)